MCNSLLTGGRISGIFVQFLHSKKKSVPIVQTPIMPKSHYAKNILSYYVENTLLGLSQEGRSWVKKISYYFLQNRKNLPLWQKYGTSKFGVITESHTKYRGINWPKTAIFNRYFQKYLYRSSQTCLKVRFYQVLHVSVSIMCLKLKS